MIFTEKEIKDFYKELGLETEHIRTERLFAYNKNIETKNTLSKPFEETILKNENASLE